MGSQHGDSKGRLDRIFSHNGLAAPRKWIRDRKGRQAGGWSTCQECGRRSQLAECEQCAEVQRPLRDNDDSPAHYDTEEAFLHRLEVERG